MTDRQKTNLEIATAIKEFCIKHELTSDLRIYFNGIAWDFDSYGKITIKENIKGSEYFEFSNDETVSVSTEGELYDVINMSFGYTLFEELNKLLDDKFSVYFEKGNAWNFSIYDN